MLTGENGLLTKAQEAKEASIKARYQEEIELIITEKQIEKSTNIREKKELIELVAEGIKQKEWEETTTICDDNENNNIDPKEGTKIIVETNEGYEIIVKIDNDNLKGEIESITKGTRKKWKITFDKNGGNGTVPEKIETGFGITLPEGKALSNTGYKFVGWSEDKEAKRNNAQIYARRNFL